MVRELQEQPHQPLRIVNILDETRRAIAECDFVLNKDRYPWRLIQLRTVRESGFSDGPWSVYLRSPIQPRWEIYGGGLSRREALAKIRVACQELVRRNPEFIRLSDLAIKGRIAEFRALGIDTNLLGGFPLYGRIDPDFPEASEFADDD